MNDSGNMIPLRYQIKEFPSLILLSILIRLLKPEYKILITFTNNVNVYLSLKYIVFYIKNIFYVWVCGGVCVCVQRQELDDRLAEKNRYIERCTLTRARTYTLGMYTFIFYKNCIIY